MSEQPGPVETAAPVRTGVAHVDQVLAAVEQLEDRPVEEHVGVFETAHDRLRRALDADPDARLDAPLDAGPDAAPGTPA